MGDGVRRRLRTMLGPRLRDVRLFGSKARGDDPDESDIDILVLVDQLDLGHVRREGQRATRTWRPPSSTRPPTSTLS